MTLRRVQSPGVVVGYIKSPGSRVSDASKRNRSKYKSGVHAHMMTGRNQLEISPHCIRPANLKNNPRHGLPAPFLAQTGERRRGSVLDVCHDNEGLSHRLAYTSTTTHSFVVGQNSINLRFGR